MEKPKCSIIWKTSDRRGHLSELWHSQVVIVHVRGAFDLIALRVILGLFGALAIFPTKTISKKNTLLRPKFIKHSPRWLLNGPHKPTFGIFEILKIEI